MDTPGNPGLDVRCPSLPGWRLWELLTMSSGAMVAIFTEAGICTYLNAVGTEICGDEQAGLEAALDAASSVSLRREMVRFRTSQHPLTLVLSINSASHEATLVRLSAPESGVLLVARPQRLQQPVDVLSLHRMLTRRELQILASIGNDEPVDQTCESLGISAKTFRNYVALLRRKLSVGTKVEMASLAARAGLCSTAR